jgi:hypothetical protein
VSTSGPATSRVRPEGPGLDHVRQRRADDLGGHGTYEHGLRHDHHARARRRREQPREQLVELRRAHDRPRHAAGHEDPFLLDLHAVVGPGHAVDAADRERHDVRHAGVGRGTGQVAGPVDEDPRRGPADAVRDVDDGGDVADGRIEPVTVDRSPRTHSAPSGPAPERVSTRTVWPRPSSSRTSGAPALPVPPATSTFI